MEYELARKRLLKFYGRIIPEFEQMIRDLEWWNNNRTECKPFDIESTRIALSKAKQIYQIVLTESGPIPDELRDGLLAALQEEI